MLFNRLLTTVMFIILITVFISSICLAADITVKADPRLPVGIVEHVKNAALDTIDFYQKVYNIKLEKPVEIVLVTSQEDFRKALIEVLKFSPENAEKFSKNNKGVSSWNIVTYGISEKSSEFYIYTHISHEMTHTVQRQITGSANAPGKLTWLWEGMANVIPAQMIETKGIRPVEERRKDWLRYTKDQTIRPSIQILLNQEEWFKAQTIFGVNNVYNLATIAVDYLSQKKGDSAIIEYVRCSKGYPNAEAAFKQAFGMTMGEFANEFNGYLTAKLGQ